MTDWYNRQTAANADTLLAEAAALFEKNPMLGVLSPSLPLWQGCTAQKNGAYAAAFEPLTRSAARADILNEYETAAAQPAAVAKQLGRVVKHRLQK